MTGRDPRDVAGVREGEVLADKYRVEKVLGVGGMGAVVAARHLQLGSKVALKFLLPEMLNNTEAVGRFAREARAAVRITSEHVARVFDVGVLDNGAPFMVMEFLEGGDLGAWLRQRGPLPIEQTVDFVLQACVGLADAHGLGIVHRDLKPANLFCLRRSDGTLVIKVLDFGISKVTNLSDEDVRTSITHASAVMGSPHYMSPEQMQSTKDVDAQTDIWALGITLYELLTGAPPFRGESFAEIAIKVATGQAAPIRGLRPDVPAGVAKVIVRCLEKDKEKRFRDVAELALALAPFGLPSVQPSIERIVGILQAAGLPASTRGSLAPLKSSRTPAPAAGVSHGDSTTAPPEPSLSVFLGTMAPSATTPPGMRRWRKGTGEPRPRRLAVVGIFAVVGATLGAVVVGVTMRPSGVVAPPNRTVSLSPAATPTPSLSLGESAAIPPHDSHPVELKPADTAPVASIKSTLVIAPPVRGPLKELPKRGLAVGPAEVPTTATSPAVSATTATKDAPLQSPLVPPAIPTESDPLARLKPK